jgi:hypothetical protein
MAFTILHFLSPRAPKALPPVCTLAQSVSSMTVSVRAEKGPFIQAPEATYVSPYSQKSMDSNQRTKNQFRPRNATKGTTSYQLRQYAEATLGGGSLRKIVKLPEGEDENEWLAVNSKKFNCRRECTSLPQFSGGLLQSYQPSLRIDHRILLPTIMSRDEGHRRVCKTLFVHANLI